MAITSVIMITLFTLVGQSTASYTQTQRAVNAVSEARAFVQFFDRELSTRLPGTPLIHEEKSGPDPSDSACIAFVRVISSNEPYEDDPGDLSTSIYYVDFSRDGASDISPKLFRKSLGPEDTQSLIESGSNPVFPQIDPTEDEPIIPNILSFKATPMFRDATRGELKEWESTSPEPPSVIELTFTFVDDSSAQRFRTKTEWNRLANAPRDSERQLVRTFARNIPIAK